MKKSVLVLIASVVLAAAVPARADGPIVFGDYFDGKSLRFDLFQVGDAKTEEIVLDHIYKEGDWPGNPAGAIEPFEYGKYRVRVFDIASNRLIYSSGFDAMFGEYRTTTPAVEGTKRALKRSVRIPAPLRPFLFMIEARDRMNIARPLYQLKVDPADYHIIRENPAAGDYIYEPLISGSPAGKVDFVFVAEGYTAAEKDKFKSDLDRFMGWLFEIEPYKSRRNDFNIRGVFRPSTESAMDEPRQERYRKTALNASFNAFDTDRYMLIEEGHRLREMADQVPCDAIIVMVNSKRYGGGGIYNDYCVTTVDNERSRNVFVHELGHSFAGLGDEYYTSEVAYNEFYAKGVEPLEPNITALLDPAHVKWAAMLSPGIGIPTEHGKDELDSLQAAKMELLMKMRGEIDQAKSAGAGPDALKKIEEGFKAKAAPIDGRIAEIRKKYAGLNGKVGVFEGAGYAAKGLYRPMMECIMFSNARLEFCAVCRQAISRMIDFYCSGK